MTTLTFTPEGLNATASGLSEFISGRWGETGHFLGTDDDGWIEPARALIAVIDAGGEPYDSAHTAYLVPAVRRALSAVR